MKRIFFYVFLAGLAVSLSAVGSMFAYAAWDLPSVETLKTYHPRVSTEVYSADLVKLGEFSKERRFYVPIKDIPKNVQNAFLAAEDAKFYEHGGVSFTGIMRAALKNVIAGKTKQGASTITQQVAKNLLLSSERTFTRKVKEVILAFRMERNISKSQILEIYLNEIFLGEASYGVAAAAETYFGKSLQKLTIAEAAVLAGLPRAPSRDNPRANIKQALVVRNHVLARMREENMIDEESYKKAKESVIVLAPQSSFNMRYAPYFVEHVRRYLIEKYGEKIVLEEGLKVITTIDVASAIASEKALKEGIEEIDKHQGYRGPLEKVKTSEISELKKKLAKQADDDERERTHFKAVVLDVDDKNKLVKISTGVSEGTIALDDMNWARTPNSDTYWQYALIKKPSQALSAGDVILVKSLPEKGKFSLFQEPQVQGALIALDPRTGIIRAMTGGYDYKKSEFNRAIQAKRQPGSAFKPFIYGAALASGKYTPASIIPDAPLVFEDFNQDSSWKPKNYGGEFKGDMILRDCLIQSRNTPTIRVLQDIGIKNVIAFAKSMGIESELKNELSMALGSSVVSPMELARAYAPFANGGRRIAQDIFIQQVTDRQGNLLERNTFEDPSLSALEQTVAVQEKLDEKNQSSDSEHPLSPQIAFIMTHLLEQVISLGTGSHAKAINRPAAGKTGTTDDNIDAWFVGYTPELVTVVWVGYDDPSKSLGVKEDGGQIAAPIWLSFMQAALNGKKIKEFEVPPGVIKAEIDRQNGLLASPKTAKPITEYFVEGTEPKEMSDSVHKNQKNSQEFFINE